MSEAVWTILLSGVFSIIGSLVVVSVAWKKAPAENRQLTADTAQRYQEIATRAADKIIAMQEQLDKLQGRVDDLECQLAERDQVLEDWYMGITRLIQQLESHEYKPVWQPKAAPAKQGGKA